MSGAPLPVDEDARLEALRGLDAYNDEAVPGLDRLTSLAAQLLEVPVAAISLLGPDREICKAGHGLTRGREVDRSQAFCAYAILEEGQTVVPDTHKDPRFIEHPFVTGRPHIRAYAASPLTTSIGQRVGALCVIDVVPREFTAGQLGALKALAAAAIAELESRCAGEIWRAPPEEPLPSAESRRSAEASYHGIFENAAEGIFRSEPGGGLLSGNPALARLLGYDSAAEMVANLRDLSTVYVQPGRRAELEQLIRDRGVVLGFESEMRRRDGSTVWVSENMRVVFDGNGGVVRYEGTLQDISARRSAAETRDREHEELERRVRERTAELAAANEALRLQIAQREHAEVAVRRSEGKFRALLENAQDMISIIDSGGAVLYISPSVAHILGYQPEQMVGGSVLRFIHPEDHPSVELHLAQICREGAEYVRCELRFLHRDGTLRLLESIASLAPPDSPVVGVVVNSRDITERKKVEIGLENHARLQEATAELGRHALACLDDQQMFAAAAAVVAKALRTELSTINELLPGGKELLIRAGVGWPAGVAGKAVVKNWRMAFEPTGEEPLYISDLREFRDLCGILPDPHKLGPASALSVLIRAGRDCEPFGTVCALSMAPREFSREEITFLQTIADLLSTVIERHRHQEALRLVEARYQRIVANTPGMVYQFLLRKDGTMALPFASEGSREVYGLEPRALMANPQLVLGAVHPEDQASMYRSITESAASLRPWHWEGRMVMPIGTKWIQGASRPRRLENGDVLWDGIIMDVSERRRAQEALRIAKEEAERASNAKSEFLSRMSHELRTPLNAILGFGQLLEIEDLGPAHNQSVEYILGAGRRLLELVDDVLDLSRIETGRAALTSEPVDLTAALRTSVQMLGSLAQQRGVGFIHLAPLAPCIAVADPARVGQVLLNLVSNAVKHSPVGESVRFACRPVRGGRVRLAVTDRGGGLEPEGCAHLFTAFERLGSSPAGVQGVGMGLAISKRVMDAMGGTIGVRSVPGRGATFFIELPAAPAPLGTTEARRASQPKTDRLPPPPALPARTVLYLAGNSADARLIERLLERRPSVKLLIGVDPPVGLELAARLRPDLILLDSDDPGIFRRLRHDSRTRSIPVIVLSATPLPVAPADGIQRLPQLCLSKPLDAVTFLRAVDGALATRSSASPL